MVDERFFTLLQTAVDELDNDALHKFREVGVDHNPLWAEHLDVVVDALADLMFVRKNQAGAKALAQEYINQFMPKMKRSEYGATHCSCGARFVALTSWQCAACRRPRGLLREDGGLDAEDKMNDWSSP